MDGTMNGNDLIHPVALLRLNNIKHYNHGKLN